MAYSALAVANAFIERSRQGRLSGLTPMKLQKLLFYVQSWYFKQRRQPLFDDTFVRWTYGPVIPSIYHVFREYGSSIITNPGSIVVPKTGAGSGFEAKVPSINWGDIDAVSFIDEAIKVYGPLSAWQLSQMTHQTGTAWDISGAPDGGPIPLDIMADHIHPEKTE